MKNIFTKNTGCFIVTLCLILGYETSYAQWNSNIHSNYWNLNFGTVKVTSSGGSVAGTSNYSGALYYGANLNTDDINTAATNGWITQTTTNTSPGNRFKATAGQPVTITLEFDFRGDIYNDFVLDSPTTYNGGGNTTNPLPGGIGKNEETNTFDQNIGIPVMAGTHPSGVQKYQGTFTFNGARAEAWVVIQFITFRGEVQERVTMVLPFIVEGVKRPQVPLVTNGPNGSGQPRIITQPSLPITVIHAPPGDKSYSKFEISKTSCQSVQSNITTGLSQSGYGAVKLGTKGSVGLIAQIDVEAYVQFSASYGSSSSNAIMKEKETCISTTTGFGTSEGSGEDIFVCEGLDYYYGVYETLFINPSNYSTFVKSGFIMVPVDGTQRLNFLTKSGILNEINTLALDTLNTSLSIKQRVVAKNQLNVWKQLIALNTANIANANTPTIPSYPLISLSGGAALDYSVSVSTSQTNTIQVDNYIESGVGIEAVVNVGGSGISAGLNFSSNRSYGATNSVTNSSTQTISMHLEDDDSGDLLKINIYQDRMFGTPVFKLQNDSRTSCPYEGGYSRDQPSLQIAGTTNNTITLSNITLGSPASFQVKACNNNVSEQRTYNMSFVSQSNSSDLLITAAGSTGSQFGSFTVPANSCMTQNFDVNISRRYATSDVNFSNLEFQLYSPCEPSIGSSIFANVSFAAPPPASNVSVSSTTICSGSPVTLSATCPVSTTPTWYDVATGGFNLAVGSSVTLNPTTNTTYYVGCETPNYIRNRVATKSVLVGNPSATLNLTSNFTTSTFQIANTTLTANNKILSPANAVYKAGNSLTFNPGFEVKSGSSFEAKIGGCTN